MFDFIFRKDFLYVYDGPTMASSLIFTSAGSFIPDFNIITSGPDVFIRFVKESQLTVFKGFELRYDTGKS